MDQRDSDGRCAQQRTRFLWFIWFLWFVLFFWFVRYENQTNQINQINEIDQRNELKALGDHLPPETPHILTA